MKKLNYLTMFIALGISLMSLLGFVSNATVTITSTLYPATVVITNLNQQLTLSNTNLSYAALIMVVTMIIGFSSYFTYRKGGNI